MVTRWQRGFAKACLPLGEPAAGHGAAPCSPAHTREAASPGERSPVCRVLSEQGGADLRGGSDTKPAEEDSLFSGLFRK